MKSNLRKCGTVCPRRMLDEKNRVKDKRINSKMMRDGRSCESAEQYDHAESQ